MKAKYIWGGSTQKQAEILTNISESYLHPLHIKSLVLRHMDRFVFSDASRETDAIIIENITRLKDLYFLYSLISSDGIKVEIKGEKPFILQADLIVFSPFPPLEELSFVYRFESIEL